MHFANKIHIGNEKCLMDQYMSGQWSLYNKRKQEHPVNVPTFQAYCRCFYVWILGTLRLNLWTYRSKLTLVDWLLLYPDHCLKIKKNDRVNKDINIYVKIIFFMFYSFLLNPTGVENKIYIRMTVQTKNATEQKIQTSCSFSHDTIILVL